MASPWCEAHCIALDSDDKNHPPSDSGSPQLQDGDNTDLPYRAAVVRMSCDLFIHSSPMPAEPL